MKISALAIVILAAGKGTRMNSDLPKVLHKVAGRELILRVLDVANELDPVETVVVVGHQKELVQAAIHGSGVKTAVQDPPKGTGHAVMQAEAALTDDAKNVLILSGDVPLLRADTLIRLVRDHIIAACQLTVLSTAAPNPHGYGRILRDESGSFAGIVEERDATDEQRKIREINSGVYVVEKTELFSALKDVKPNNAKAEYYLTDIVGILREQGAKIQAVSHGSFDELQGINTPEELLRAEQQLKTRIVG
ncbi:MAG: NTP transferase domain-containing protein [Calditrichaeota bacterium]|nr:NTP transferase domain-containing protein [Calditrichota bacterium]MCB9366361.1 NTP transferase domain-containing protein [Calditrichota bacterium]